MRRGEIITVAPPGDSGKLRPALVIQSDRFAETRSVTVLPISSMLIDAPLFRITVDPTPENGLRKRSQIMVDKALSVKRDKAGGPIGQLAPEAVLAVTRSLTVFLGIA